MCEICLKLAIETAERRLFLIENECKTLIGCPTFIFYQKLALFWRFFVNFEHILHLVLVFYPFKIFFKTPGSFLCGINEPSWCLLVQN